MEENGKMINENPDTTMINGETYHWYDSDGYTVAVLLDYKGRKQIIITRGEGSEFYINIGGKDLTKFVKKNYPNFNYNVIWRHEDIVRTLSQIKPDGQNTFIKYDDATGFKRHELNLAGRVWEINDNIYLSFWNSRRSCKNNIEDIDKILDILKYPKEAAFFEFIDYKNQYLSYKEAFTTNFSKSKTNIEADLLAKAHSMPPGMKNFIYKGMNNEQIITKSKLREILKDIIAEALALKRTDDEIAVVSDLENPKLKSQETYKWKNDLKSAGFRWQSDINSWVISPDRLAQAQDVIARINKSPITKYLTAFEDLPEFVLASDNLSRKQELSQEIERFIEILGGEVDAVKASEEMQRFIEFNRKFRTYSLNNTLLIYLQRPTATKVAGFRVWEKKFFRRVKKGVKGISIFAPFKFKDTDEKIDDKGLDAAVKKKEYIMFRVVTVFDIADTEPIDERGNVPEHPEWHAKDEPNELADKLYVYAEEFAKDIGITVKIDNAKGREQGFAQGDHIQLSATTQGVNRLSTLIHEIAHELLHFKGKSLFHVDDEKLTSETKELHAEATAYVVMRHYNFDVKHSAVYLANWKANPQALKDHLSIIKKVSNFIINGIDKIAEEHIKTATPEA